MIKDKGDKVGGNRNTIKEELPDNDAGMYHIYTYTPTSLDFCSDKPKHTFSLTHTHAYL